MARDGKQNVILILADDLGYECLGCYDGKSYKTPNLDGMAERGVRFNHAYSLPLCTPTRVALMTGKYNFRNWKAFGVLDPDEKTFGHYMQDAGYATCITGKWQLWSYNPPDFEPEWRGKGMVPEDSGFDEYFLWHAGHTEDKGSRYADPVILDNGEVMEDTEGQYGPDLFTGYLLDFASRHKGEPFFIYYPMALTHGPFKPTPDSEGWAGDRHKNDVNNFGDMVEYTDKLIGYILEGLEELGLREDTLVMFIGDNGSPREVTSLLGDRPFVGGKGETTNAGTRVPFVCEWGGRATGVVSDDLIDLTDFLPTMMQAARVSMPGDAICDGRSFLPQLMGEEGNPRDWIYQWHNPLPGQGKSRYRLQEWAQDQRFKLYDDGRFYDLVADDLEQTPIGRREGDEEAEDAREKLEIVVDHYKQQQG
ncbi:MAG: arylsulfatase A [Gemmatimonadetes bacterium]|nr:arylsulfatase A [Gemmatimonadota bacterium]